MNRLAQTSSPYLLQHKDNPVAWQPWDAQALEQARRENKPIFLSIGYSTCHWCHVMAHESFENEEVAQIVNSQFVCIKVDREERPDLDDLYMTAVQQMTGHGGWPMSVWLTPELKPFFGGTYFSKNHFIALSKKIHEIWTRERDKLEADGERMLEVIRTASQIPAVEKDRELTATILDRFAQDCKKSFEPEFGGFGRAPKFPAALTLMTLMRLESTEAMVRKTLDGMCRGGMYDHLAGGFHRYSTDAQWLVPHFEKMLYDNALLATCYLEAFQRFKDPEYARVARETLDYLLREMQDPNGGFYSAQDADSLNPQTGHSEEGYFATFTFAQLRAVLSDSELSQLQRIYGVSEAGQFEGRNILHLQSGASRRDLDHPDAQSALKKLQQLRSAKPRPHLDDKIVAEWNGYAIMAFAKAWQVFAEPLYLAAAQKAAQFILQQMHGAAGWVRTFRKGQLGPQAFAEDFAALISGLLNLYESDFDFRWYQVAIDLQKELDQRFWDSDGGYFRTSHLQDDLLVRIKDDYDGVTPTASSLSAVNLLRLYAFSMELRYQARAQKIFSGFHLLLQQAPQAISTMVSAIHFYLHPAREIAIIYPQNHDQAQSLIQYVRSIWAPWQVIACGVSGQNSVPLLRGRTPVDAQPTVYVCQHHNCLRPVTTLSELKEILESRT